MDFLGPQIVLVDDDDPMRMATARRLRGLEFEVHDFASAEPALSFLSEHENDVDVIVSDLHMPKMDGLAFLAESRRCWPDLPFVMLTADSSNEPAIEALRQGAYDHLTKPLAPGEELRFHLLRAVERHRLLRRTRELERQRDVEARFEGIVGTSASMRAVFTLVERVASTDATALVLGESGTGKELVARAIHARSQRAAKPFLAVNCSALSETLLESELFGHVKAAFSGATSARRGLFEEASGGTLFLDEIGDVDASVQVRLLRALQEGEIKPVGSNEVRKVDVRVIAATNRDLAADVREGEFREDLFYRLNVVSVDLPALRDRSSDIPLLTAHFLAKYCARFERPVPPIQPDAMRLLTAYRWPGNVRELENAIQRAIAVMPPGSAVTADVLPPALRDVPRPAQGPTGSTPTVSGISFSESRALLIADFEKRYIEELLEIEKGNITRAARRGGIDRANFRRLARRYGIDLGRRDD